MFKLGFKRTSIINVKNWRFFFLQINIEIVEKELKIELKFNEATYKNI